MHPKHSWGDHKRKSDHDCKLAQELSAREEYCDWTIVCAFYFAVHCVEAYAHKIGKERELKGEMWDEESLHRKRERFVQKNLRDYFSIYQRLYDKSRKCRYDPRYYEEVRKLKVYHQKLLKSALKLRRILK